MTADKRVTLPRRQSYKTRSHLTKHVKTPGGRLTLHLRNKLPPKIKCRSCKVLLSGIKSVRYHHEKLGQNRRSVSRKYGGVLCAKCVTKNIRRVFYKTEISLIRKVAAQNATQAA